MLATTETVLSTFPGVYMSFCLSVCVKTVQDALMKLNKRVCVLHTGSECSCNTVEVRIEQSWV